jgi:hypothetical protein
MELARVIISETNDEQIIVLKEVNGTRAFPIVIGIWEAFAIDRNLKEKKTPRPMTHDLIENVIRSLDGALERIVVSDLRNQTFFAKLMIRRNGKMLEVDSRPSDAIALAVQMKVPIYVEEKVLESARPPDEMQPPNWTPDQDEDEEK